MGKSTRSKVKKRFRTVKSEISKPGLDFFFFLWWHLLAFDTHHAQDQTELFQTFQTVQYPYDTFSNDTPSGPLSSKYLSSQYDQHIFQNLDHGSHGLSGFSVGYLRNINSGMKNSQFEIELEEIPEANESEEDDFLEREEEDMLAEFEGLGLDGVTKKIKKKKFSEISQSKSFVLLNSKKKLASKDKERYLKSQTIW